jgi:hypothetical protein
VSMYPGEWTFNSALAALHDAAKWLMLPLQLQVCCRCPEATQTAAILNC